MNYDLVSGDDCRKIVGVGLIYTAKSGRFALESPFPIL